MSQFLVRLGQIKHIEHAVPLLNCTIAFAYCGVQFACHDFIRNIFVAQSPSGYRERISNHVRNLITETQDVCLNNGWCNIKSPIQVMDWPLGKIKWFASSTLEPFTYGSTYIAPGLLIGVPSFYNYTKTDDIPDQAFEIKRVALLRSAQDQSREEKSKIRDEGIDIDGAATGVFVVRKIGRDSEEGLKYADTLILSDDAKRFSIAREMFYGDSYYPFFKSSVLFISLIMASTIGRLSVMKFELKRFHLRYRMAVYALSGACAFLTHKGIRSLLDQYYATLADNRAKALGSNYQTGAEEYYSKRAQRRKILGLN